MNFRIIAYIVGWVCNFQAAFMLLPFFTALIYHEREFSSFLIAMAVCLVIGIPLTLKKPKNKVFYTKDGCVAVALSWVALCVFGALPFVVSGYIPHPVDALFETVSGFTTTGSSILTDVEVLPALCSDLAKLHTLDRRNGSSCISAFPAPAHRWISHESYESRKPGTFCQQTGSKGTVHCQNSLYYLFWYDTCSDSPAVDWKSSSF